MEGESLLGNIHCPSLIDNFGRACLLWLGPTPVERFCLAIFVRPPLSLLFISKIDALDCLLCSRTRGNYLYQFTSKRNLCGQNVILWESSLQTSQVQYPFPFPAERPLYLKERLPLRMMLLFQNVMANGFSETLDLYRRRIIHYSRKPLLFSFIFFHVSFCTYSLI